jgi:hypothetical protein
MPVCVCVDVAVLLVQQKSVKERMERHSITREPVHEYTPTKEDEDEDHDVSLILWPVCFSGCCHFSFK